MAGLKPIDNEPSLLCCPRCGRKVGANISDGVSAPRDVKHSGLHTKLESVRMVYAERSKTQLRIGVDCGGTNTDAVIVDLSPGVSANDIVLASYKTPTTPEVTHGIQDSIRTVLVHASHIEREHIQSVSIGTTHFVNALVTRAADRLDKVAVIRLCGPFSRRTKPFIGFPMALRGVMEGAHYFVDGGLQIDGRVIRDVDEEQIKKVCEDIKGKVSLFAQSPRLC